MVEIKGNIETGEVVPRRRDSRRRSIQELGDRG